MYTISEKTRLLLEKMKSLGYKTHFYKTDDHKHRFFFYWHILDFPPYGEGKTFDEAIVNAYVKCLRFYKDINFNLP